ncbi:hypothetical protein [Metabacillus niabensis]|uniref:Uncharacterized protein n=1 Tax=Metabacillus niabensis TaxID=324854 RepID=A0ABT9Z591_9BACI|nr:hypothetical protein [Metabacillus niabensis]MDQ0227426.1 hypothetical protein [Metabacillus niabensis]
MSKKGYWIIIFLTLIVNIVMLQMTVESFFGEEYERIYTFSTISIISSVICFFTFLRWRKNEYD